MLLELATLAPSKGLVCNHLQNVQDCMDGGPRDYIVRHQQLVRADGRGAAGKDPAGRDTFNVLAVVCPIEIVVQPKSHLV